MSSRLRFMKGKEMISDCRMLAAFQHLAGGMSRLLVSQYIFVPLMPRQASNVDGRCQGDGAKSANCDFILQDVTRALWGEVGGSRFHCTSHLRSFAKPRKLHLRQWPLQSTVAAKSYQSSS